MNRIAVRFSSLVILLVLAAGSAFAQAATANRDEALRNFSDAADKAVRLAEAMPAEKYTWRPTEGVRSVSELFLHIAAGNFSISRRFGATVPAGIQLNAEFEKQTTDKAKVIEAMAKTDYNSPLGRMTFKKSEEGGLNQAIDEQIITQWQNGVPQVVFPEKKATAKLVYPTPNWKNR